MVRTGGVLSEASTVHGRGILSSDLCGAALPGYLYSTKHSPPNYLVQSSALLASCSVSISFRLCFIRTKCSLRPSTLGLIHRPGLLLAASRIYGPCREDGGATSRHRALQEVAGSSLPAVALAEAAIVARCRTENSAIIQSATTGDDDYCCTSHPV